MTAALLSTGPTVLDLSRIGASDAPAVLGVDRYATAHDVFARCAYGIAKARPDWLAEMGAWGHRIEPLTAQALAERLDLDPAGLGKPASRNVACRDWQRVSPDFVLEDLDAPAGAHLVECKLVSERRFTAEPWGESGSQDVPHRIVAQVTFQVEAMRAERDWWLSEHAIDPEYCDEVLVAVNVGGLKLEHYRVPYDPELAAAIRERCERLWTDHVVPQVLPPPDGSDAALKVLERLYPHAKLPVRPATPEEAEIAREYARAKEQIKALEWAAKGYEAQLRQAIADARGIALTEGEITWISRKGSTKWRDVAHELATKHGLRSELDDLTTKHTGEGSRYLRSSLALED